MRVAESVVVRGGLARLLVNPGSLQIASFPDCPSRGQVIRLYTKIEESGLYLTSANDPAANKGDRWASQPKSLINIAMTVCHNRRSIFVNSALAPQ